MLCIDVSSILLAGGIGLLVTRHAQGATKIQVL